MRILRSGVRDKGGYGVLEYGEFEFLRGGREMIEDVGLDGFVFVPDGGGGKNVNLKREAGCAGFKLTHQKREVFADCFKALQVLHDVHTECSEVGQAVVV